MEHVCEVCEVCEGGEGGGGDEESPEPSSEVSQDCSQRTVEKLLPSP